MYLYPKPRYRTQGKTVSDGSYKFQSLWASCSQPSWTDTTGSFGNLQTGNKVEMWDWIIPKFHTRKARGEIFMNPLKVVRTVASRGGWSNVHTMNVANPMVCGGSTVYPQGRGLGGPDWEIEYINAFGGASGMLKTGSAVLSSRDVNDLVVEASTRVASERGRSSSNLWETLAEVDKSAGLLNESLTKLYKLGKSKAFSSKVRSASQLWLMYRYGLMPLVMDSAQIVKGIQQKVGTQRQTSRAATSGSTTRRQAWTRDGGNNLVYIQEDVTDTVSVRAMSLDTYEASVYSNIGLTTKGLITLPWELIPYSFVVDWFANVGDYLGAIVPAVGWKQLGSCVVVRRSISLRAYTTSNIAKTGTSLVSPRSGSYASDVITIERSSGLNHPNIVVKGDFRFHNINRCLDSLSLLATRFLRG